MFFNVAEEELALLRLQMDKVLAGMSALETRVAALEHTPIPEPVPETRDYVLLSKEDIMRLPTSGPAWENVLSWASKAPASPNLSNQDDKNDVTALAKALVYARTGERRDEVVQMLKAARGTEFPGDTLGIARGVLPLVLAADLIGYREDAEWLAWLGNLRTWANPDRGYSLVSMHERRPNNWGTHAGAGRIAVDLFLHDDDDLTDAVDVFQGYLGDRARYAAFEYGSDMTWHVDASSPVGVNSKGAERSGVILDGILPDDMRRGSSFPTIGSNGISYTYEALQGMIMQAELLYKNGYAAYSWQDKAVLRAFDRIYREQPPSGDDLWQVWVINRRYDTNYPTTTPVQPGKSFGFADWLYGG